MTEMNLQRFAAIIESYGAEARRWPASERTAAEALLRDSLAARAMLGEATAMDRLLDAVPALASTPDLRGSVLAQAPRKSQISLTARLAAAWQELLGELGGWRIAGTALAASLVLGVLTGGFVSAQSSVETSPDLLQVALLDDTAAEY